MTTTVQVGGRGGTRSPRPDPDQRLLLPGDWERLRSQEAANHFLLPVGTHWVERDVLMVSEEIARRFPNLSVVSCSCGNCSIAGHYPHMVVEACRDGQTRPVFGFLDFGSHIIERLQQIHVSNGDVNLAKMHRENARASKLKRERAQAAVDEAAEILEAALSSSKQDWKGPDGLRTDPYSKQGRVL